jgi:hypothetical protein
LKQSLGDTIAVVAVTAGEMVLEVEKHHLVAQKVLTYICKLPLNNESGRLRNYLKKEKKKKTEGC